MSDGLNKDGGISFGRKKEPDVTEVEKEIEEPKRLDTEELLRQERLGKKLATSKRVFNSGFAINSSTIIGCFFYLDSLLVNPDFMENLNMINGVFGLEIDFEKWVAVIQQWKTEIIGFAISSQTMLMGYKDTCKKMKDRDTESFYEVFSEELEKAGI